MDATEEVDGLTEDDLERIRAFARKDPADRNPLDLVPEGDPTGAKHSVDETDERRLSDGSDLERPESTCAEIRRRMGEATTAREVVEEYPDRHVSEIMRHAYGECTCSTPYPPKASPQIRSAECREFRSAYASGRSVAEIAETFARSANSVTRHLFGRCSHGVRPRDLSPSEVTARECEHLRATFNRNEKVDLPAVAAAMRLRREVASFHLFGLCDCETAEPPAEGTRPRDPHARRRRVPIER